MKKIKCLVIKNSRENSLHFGKGYAVLVEAVLKPGDDRLETHQGKIWRAQHLGLTKRKRTIDLHWEVSRSRKRECDLYLVRNRHSVRC